MFFEKYPSVLITGGAGFIGSHLSEALLNLGCKVTIIDDLSTGKWENINHLEGNKNFRGIIASAAESDLLVTEVPRHDLVYHLASAVGVKNIIDNPVNTVESIYKPTEAVLHMCARYRKPFLLTSTSEVYGKSESVPFKEEDDVVMGSTEKRRWAYACAKALDEFLTLAYHYETSLPVYVVRLFNTVGERQTGQYGMVVPSFVDAALEGAPLSVYGDGLQRRCFCSVLDVVDALIKLPLNSDAVAKIVNIGSQEEVSIIQLAQKVIERCKSNSKIEIISYEDAYGPGFDDMQRRVPYLERAETFIKWKPRYNLNDIIDQVIAGRGEH